MLRKNLLYSLCFALIAFSSCRKNNNPQPDLPGTELNLTPLQQQKVMADNAFSLKLFNTVSPAAADGTNMMISPLSVSFAMAIANNGANGQTLTDINNGMFFNGFTQDQVNTYYNTLITGLPQVDPNNSLNIANSIWYSQNFSVLPQFLQTNSSLFQAKVQAADFSSSATPALINQWVSDQTHGVIPAIVNSIPSDALMYIINAIYFKSTWNTGFDASKTHTQTFYPSVGFTVQASFMTSPTMTYNSYFDDQVHITELPYHDKKYSMVIIMPVNNSSITSVMSSLDSVKWNSWMSQLQSTSGYVTMPKFKFSFGTSLVPALSSMGMSSAFSKQADFTRINPAGGLYITDVEHKAYIEVNEDGTTAAAVTSVVVGTTAIANSNNLIDHSFIFAIREVKTGLILFTGIMNNPQLSGQ